MSSVIPFAGIITHSLGWALFHSLWQGAAIFILLRFIFILVPSLSARLKYHFSFLALGLVFSWFVCTFFNEWQKLQAITVTITEGGATGQAKVFSVQTLPQQPEALPVSDQVLLRMEQYFPWIVVIYMAGIVFLCLRFTVNLLQIRSWKNKGVETPGQHLLELLDTLKLILDINKPVKLLLSYKLQVPVVFGAIKPIILLPAATLSQLSMDQLEAILIHELAHIKRHDYLLNILQTMMETTLFFNPFTWLISAGIRKEREHCCDDIVLKNTIHPLPYAQALASMEEYRLSSGTLAMAAKGHTNQLFHRIKRIMEMKKSNINYSHLAVAFLLIATLTVSILWLTPGFAQSAKQKEKTEAKKPMVKKDVRVIVKDDDGKVTEYSDTEDMPEEAREALQEADETLKNLDVDISTTVSKAFENIDWKNIDSTVQSALKEADMEHLGDKVTMALKAVDWDQINEEIEKAENDPKVRAEVREEMAKARKEVARARKEIARAHVEIVQSGKEMREAQRRMAKDRHHAMSAVDRELLGDDEDGDGRHAKNKHVVVVRNGDDDDANVPMPPMPAVVSRSNNFEEMLDKMEAENLIDRDKDFEVKKTQDGKLYINGVEQYDYIYARYKKYLKADKIKINGKKNSLNVNVQDSN